MSESPAGLRRVTVLGGGGLMGHGIGLAALQGATCEVTLVARTDASLQHGLGLMRSGPFGLNKAVARGKIGAERADELMGLVTVTTDLAEGVSRADLVVETIPEVVAAKQAVLRQAEAHAPSSAIFATNTSAIMISELAGAMDDPARLVGTHWFYPANVMPLVEVAMGQRTHLSTMEVMVGFLTGIGKKPVVVADAPGFFMTRFINLYIAEAIRLVELGIAGPREVDEMVKTGLGWPMGIFEMLDDTASFDSWYHAQEYLHETLGERYAVPALARRVFSAGFRGAASLKPGSRGGWYEFLGVGRGESPPPVA